MLGNDDRKKLYVLGTRGSYPVAGKEYDEFGGLTSCYIIKDSQYALIIDCGTGLYNAKDILKDCNKIDIVLTHVHYDHILGLLKPMVFPSSSDVTIYGAFDKWLGSNTINEFYRRPFWPVNISNFKTKNILNNGTKIVLNDSFSFCAYESSHPDSTLALLIDVDGKTISFATDYEHIPLADISFIENSDYLFFDGMYDIGEYEGHEGWGHSSWLSGCEIAKKHNVKNLIITHHNAEKTDSELLEMEKRSKDYFDNIRFARVNDIVKL